MTLALATLLAYHSTIQKYPPTAPGPCFTDISDQKEIDTFEEREKKAARTLTLAEFGAPYISIYNKQHSLRQPFGPMTVDHFSGEHFTYGMSFAPVNITPLPDGFTMKVVYHHWGTPDDPETATRYYRLTDHTKQVHGSSIPLYPEAKLKRYGWAEVHILLNDISSDFRIVDDTRSKKVGHQ